VYDPLETFLFVLILSVEVPEFTIDGGVNFPVANFGKPLTAKATVPENPWLLTDTANVAVPPGAIVTLDGVADTENRPLTTSVTCEVRVRLPLVPVIVSG
jgi:hypothetical protein